MLVPHFLCPLWIFAAYCIVLTRSIHCSHLIAPSSFFCLLHPAYIFAQSLLAPLCPFARFIELQSSWESTISSFIASISSTRFSLILDFYIFIFINQQNSFFLFTSKRGQCWHPWIKKTFNGCFFYHKRLSGINHYDLRDQMNGHQRQWVNVLTSKRASRKERGRGCRSDYIEFDRAAPEWRENTLFFSEVRGFSRTESEPELGKRECRRN